MNKKVKPSHTTSYHRWQS